ncbi:hypothetical protein HDV00_007588 [Rhizophlyctis rosea]|nr:hypothetical protein HDV00_007588 [Rhizophlyctis rosea]
MPDKDRPDPSSHSAPVAPSTPYPHTPTSLLPPTQQFMYFPSPAATPPAVHYQAPSYFVVPHQPPVAAGHAPPFMQYVDPGQHQQQPHAAYMASPPMGPQYMPVAMMPSGANMHSMMVPMGYQPVMYQQTAAPTAPYPMAGFSFPTMPNIAHMMSSPPNSLTSSPTMHHSSFDPATGTVMHTHIPRSISSPSLASNLFGTTMPTTPPPLPSKSRRTSLPPSTTPSPAQSRRSSFTISEDEHHSIEPSTPSRSPKSLSTHKTSKLRRPSKTPRDPFVPRPANSFIRYRKDNHAQVMSEHPALSNCELSKIIAKQWAEEKPEVRREYEEAAKRGREEHKEMYPDYKYKPRKEGEIVRRPGRRKRGGEEGGEGGEGSSKGSRSASLSNVEAKSTSSPASSPSRLNPNLTITIAPPTPSDTQNPNPSQSDTITSPAPASAPASTSTSTATTLSHFPLPAPYVPITQPPFSAPAEWDSLSMTSPDTPFDFNFLDELNAGGSSSMCPTAGFTLDLNVGAGGVTPGGLFAAESGDVDAEGEVDLDDSMENTGGP